MVAERDRTADDNTRQSGYASGDRGTEPQTSTDEAQTAKPGAVRLRLRRALIWVGEYWRELFNFRFNKYMIIQVIPGVYGLALAGIALVLLYVCVEAFLVSPWRGLFFLFFAAPFSFLVAASILRALLEFYMVIFQLSEKVDELIGMRDTVNRLSNISDTVNEISSVTQSLPFWSFLARRRRSQRNKGADNTTDENRDY